MKLNSYTHIYLIGIGGIGMSALARYFLSNSKYVAGYDRSTSIHTDSLKKQGAHIHFEDAVENIPKPFFEKEKTLIIYTPAIPKDSKELNFFIQNNFQLLKRSQVLGLISREKNCIAIAGTHGKTTVSSMTAHLMHESKNSCNAFLGGISTNYSSNLILNKESNHLVVEADEFDRSFLQLAPNFAVITSMDADHLDIYANHQALISSFQEFVNLLPPDGQLLIKHNLKSKIKTERKTYTYSLEYSEADFKIANLKLVQGYYQFDILGPGLQIENARLGMPGLINVENALAAAASAYLQKVEPIFIKRALASFLGVKRRMEYIIRKEDFVYIDDYAHHPEELKASIRSVKALYPKRKLSGIFQPHLFSRTRDFMPDFAQSLALLDNLILLEIYPAREKPISGINSQALLNQVKLENKILLSKEQLIPYLKKQKPEVLLTLGAGDIDRLVNQIKGVFS